jgi:tripartite-type tricarboxylate transporter receptor subunit TctC
MNRWVWVAVSAATLYGISGAEAQVYPSKPIAIVVPFAAGGPADVLARAMSEPMRNALGQPIIVENVAGAAGALGVARVVRAAADGYTIGIGHLGTHVFNGALYNLQYDLVKDLQPIALLPANPSVIIAKKAVPAKDLKELIAWLKANPDQATVGTAGIGSAAHIASLYFSHATGVELRVVPYRSGGAPLNDLVAGHISVMFDQASNSAELVRSGAVRPFAVTAKSRLPSAPDIPTVDEAGVPGVYMSTWYGLWAPKGIPQDVLAKLNAAVVQCLSDPALRKQLTDRGSEMPGREQMSPEALAAFQKAEIEKWWPIIKAANIKPD